MLSNGKDQIFVFSSQYSFDLSNSLTLKVFASTEPRNLKIAQLQKGLILSYNGVCVVGEGAGFGVPIAKYADETVFSGSSCLHVRQVDKVVEVQKIFLMDMIARDGFRDLKLENPKIRRGIDYASALYQRHGCVAKAVLSVKPLFGRFGLKSSFIKSRPRGVVTATYLLEQKRIVVRLDFAQLSKANLYEIFVLNEQAAHFFNIYTDSDGTRLVDEEIGVWNTMTAKSAKLTNREERIGFGLKNLEDAKIRRGRELMVGSLDWVGLDYELEAKRGNFEYEIELLVP